MTHLADLTVPEGLLAADYCSWEPDRLDRCKLSPESQLAKLRALTMKSICDSTKPLRAVNLQRHVAVTPIASHYWVCDPLPDHALSLGGEYLDLSSSGGGCVGMVIG